ncbi:helix-turn-helix transcriptional regulator [Zooshikella harenae]|uniref:HTH luxR-type domain-containing protein n=1 Tax=Zooshikella harenae TaxID=2827238 RepID=A0ABS5ZIT8_9GAMM|nr:LuxR C-terminal-related transcriptional regulator [Zooshikella harenae]MBU2713160.1 hypothetical protein [Zooshikella harenae]
MDDTITIGHWKAYLNNLQLSPRQTLYTFEALHGLSDKEIARKYAVAPDTISKTIKAALHKHNLKNRTQLVAELIRTRVICPLSVSMLALSLVIVPVFSDDPLLRNRIYRTRTNRYESIVPTLHTT